MSGIEITIVAVAIAGAVFFLLRRAWRSARGRESHSCAGCEGLSSGACPQSCGRDGLAIRDRVSSSDRGES
ncbi:MAG: FeoB-associated Cys-rich membrane protein [Candidatus Eisenbacteria bacterium]|nr:FeoB-associated Cys-rich membrane protein [Candidatus Eisenbacteria bacterium]